jgi:two-component system, OmpR family, sensor histidine kinase PrrB
MKAFGRPEQFRLARRAQVSLRTRVAAASAAGALLVLVVSSVILSVVLTRQQYASLDRQLGQLSRLAAPVLVREARHPATADVPTARQRLGERAVSLLGASFTAVAYRGTAQVATVSADVAGPVLPRLSPGHATVDTAQGRYRTLTASAGLRANLTVSVGLPVAGIEAQVRDIRRAVVVVGLLAVAAAAGLGWLLAAPAVRPFRVLRDRALAMGGRDDQGGRGGQGGQGGQGDSRTRVRLDDVRGAREAEELAGALDRMLDDIELGRSRERTATRTARDFAAAAGHELRTPLTALRTDLSVLTAHPELAGPDRDDVLASLGHACARLEATLGGLEQLARGDLHDPTIRRPVDVGDVVLRATADLRRAHPDVEVDIHLPTPDVMVSGSEAGLRLALDNLLTNAVRHGRATRVDVSLTSSDGQTVVTVDDDGRGIPVDERALVTGRFVRGSCAAPGGSGLGLALVAQQAALHGGRLVLLDSPAGGLRARLELATDPPEGR